jgi:hypothetical protein
MIEAVICAGLSDCEVGRRFGVERVGRHRRRHLIKPAQDRLTIVSKGSQARQDRDRLAAAASSGSPTPAEFVEAFFGLKIQGEKLTAIEARLERVAVAAEIAGSPTGVASLAAQSFASIEVGSRLAGLPGFVPRTADQATVGTKFGVTIQFGNGTVERITTIDEPVQPPTIEAGKDADDEPAESDGGAWLLAGCAFTHDKRLWSCVSRIGHAIWTAARSGTRRVAESRQQQRHFCASASRPALELRERHLRRALRFALRW